MKNLRSILTVILTFIMVLGTFCLTAAADDSVADVNTWYGDLVKVDVTAGTEATFTCPFSENMRTAMNSAVILWATAKVLKLLL
jgi:hypothetical protein